MENIKIEEAKYRFAIFTSYILAALVASLPVNTFSSMSSKVQSVFSLGIVEVSLNTLLFPISHTVFAYPCNWLLNKKGIRISFYISAALITVGVWLRTFLSSDDPYICLLGSLLSAIGGIFILNTPSRLAINWFRSQIVPFATFTGVLTNLISMAIGLSLPGLFINSQSSAEDIINFLRLLAIIITIPMILLVFIIRQKPQLPPSIAALNFHTYQQPKYTKIMKQLFSNLNYVKLALSMSLNFGVCIGFLAILQQSIIDIGYQNGSRIISFSGFTAIVMGILANILYSIYIKLTKNYKIVMLMAAFGDLIGFVIFTIGMFKILTIWWEVVLVSALFTFNHLSIPSIYILFSSQIAFPVDQASAAGYIMAISQTFGFLIGLLFANLLDGSQQSGKLIFYITGGCIFLSSILSLTIKEDLRKLKFEQQHKSNQSDKISNQVTSNQIKTTLID